MICIINMPYTFNKIYISLNGKEKRINQII